MQLTEATHKDEIKVELQIGTLVFSNWLSYSIDNDMLIPSGAFTFTVGQSKIIKPLFLKEIDVGMTCTLRIAGTKQMTGIIDSIHSVHDEDTDKTAITIEGRDFAGQLVDCSVAKYDPTLSPYPFTTINDLNISLEDAILTILQYFDCYKSPYLRVGWDKDRLASQLLSSISPQAANIQTQSTTDGVLAKIPINQFGYAANPSETAWDFLDRFVKQAGLIMWQSPDGFLVLTVPQYNQQSSYKIYNYLPQTKNNKSLGISTGNPNKNNIKSWDVFKGVHERFTNYLVLSSSTEQTNISPTATPPTRQAFIGYATDDEVRNNRTMIIEDDSCISQALADRRALYEMSHRKVKGFQIKYMVRGHANNGYLWQVDTLTDIADDYHGLNSSYYLTQRKFTGDRMKGQNTYLTFHEKNVL